jgi:sugar phosphate isomerase/epimerase
MKRKFNRRSFIKSSALLTAGVAIMPKYLAGGKYSISGNPVRLGGQLAGEFTDPVEWIKAIKSLGYSAAYCPVQPGAPSSEIQAFRQEAGKNNLIIAEAGVWNNLFDPDETKRKEALAKNIATLHLADEIGAKCCVNISGARGEIWDGPYAGNYAKETFDLIVENVRKIIDQVRPLDAFYTLEPMPYMLPDSPDSYLKLIKAVDRQQFGAHLDPVNMISSPGRYFNNSEFLKECFAKLGPHIRSIHAKDILILPELTLHLEERRPGLGTLDYTVFLRETSRLKGVPMMLEHLKSQEDYRLAAEYVRGIGKKEGIDFLQL